MIKYATSIISGSLGNTTYLFNMKILITEEQHNKLNSYLRRIYGFMMEHLDENFSQQDICDSSYSDEEWDKVTFGDPEDHFVNQLKQSIIYDISFRMAQFDNEEPSIVELLNHQKTVEKLINEGGYEQYIRDYFKEALKNC